MKTALPSILVASLLAFPSCSSVKSSFDYTSQERYKRTKDIKLTKLGDAITLGREKARFSSEGYDLIGMSIMDKGKAMDKYALERQINNFGMKLGATHASYSYSVYYTTSNVDAANPNLHQYSIYFLRRVR